MSLPPGVGIVYFGNEYFAENRTSSHHVAERLARRVPLLYVDSPGMRPPSATGRDAGRLVRKLLQTLRPPREVSPGLWHCTVPQIPWRRYPAVARFGEWVGRLLVRRAMRSVGIRRPILWFVVPHPAPMARHLRAERVVYYCIDDYAAHPGVDEAAITACDAELLRRADSVFVAPPALLEARRRQRPDVHFAPHGVDFDLFAAAQLASTVVPPAAAGLPHPVIGFFGLLATWIDIELIESLARARPGWRFLLVGHAYADVTALQALPNVLLVGPQPYRTLGGWAKAFDVAIIPYRQNRQVHNANPLKLREYLATGKPVVSVRTPEIERFAGLVHIADTPADFLAAIESALAEQDPAAVAARQAAVRTMSWDARVTETLDIALAGLTR